MGTNSRREGWSFQWKPIETRVALGCVPLSLTETQVLLPQNGGKMSTS